MQPNNSVPPQGYDSYPGAPAAAWLYALPAISQWWWNPDESNCAVGLVDHQLDLLLPSARNYGPCFYTYCQNEFTPEGQEKKLKNAFVCNLIGTIVGLIVEVIYFAIFLTAF